MIESRGTVSGDGAPVADVERLLRERAKLLGQRPRSREEETDSLRLIEFPVGDERYAVDADFVIEIQPLVSWTRIPCAPAPLVGVVNLRGRIVTMVDLRPLLGVPFEGPREGAYVLVVENPGVERAYHEPLAILADGLPRTRGVPRSAVRASVDGVPQPAGSRLVQVVTEHMMALLDLRALFQDERIGVPDA